jgi:hypothetical protein
MLNVHWGSSAFGNSVPILSKNSTELQKQLHSLSTRTAETALNVSISQYACIKNCDYSSPKKLKNLSSLNFA